MKTDREIELAQKKMKQRYKDRKKDADKIKESLLEQLKNRNIDGLHYKDLIDDYLTLWNTKCELKHDIETNGVAIMYKNGANQYGQKKNDSVSEFNRVNAQMLSLLKDLGLKPNPLIEDEGIDENAKL